MGFVAIFTLEAEPVKELVIAKWDDRFVAWLIDFIVVGAITEAIFAVFSLPYAFSFRSFDFANFMKLATDYLQIRSVFYLLYWTYFESTSGQSLGKKVMNLKVVDMNGNIPNTATAFLQALGKSFILVIDVLIGWIFLNERRQRLLNKLSNTIVIKVKPTPEPASVKIIKEE